MRRVLFALGPLVLAACGAPYRDGAPAYAPAAYGSPTSPSLAGAAIADAPAGAKGTEQYQDYGVNPVVDPAKDRLSTFAIDVDTASYSITRRKLLQEHTLPPYAAVRAEEYINFFGYDYPQPKQGAFGVTLDAAPSPFEKGHSLVRVALQGKRVQGADRKPVHLTYLVDTSGSMDAPDRIGLAKKSLEMLTESLRPGDTVALCTYAGSVREVLAPTGIDQRAKILSAIDDLGAGGSTAMSSGIELAYRLASRTLVPGEVNRVVVLSDGDANVGNTSHEAILQTIAQYKERGITLSTVGFGSGNYKDVMMEQLADKGDGNYAYVDSEAQARHVFGEATDGLLQVIARDVKVQVDFDPAAVSEYRLIGYENRDVADKDFRNDKVDGGEVGAGHSVTAFYDVVFKPGAKASPITVRVRAKPPLGSETATETSYALDRASIAPTFDAAPQSFRFAAAVAGFAEILRKSPHAHYGFDLVARIAEGSTGDRPGRREFVTLVNAAAGLSSSSALAK